MSLARTQHRAAQCAGIVLPGQRIPLADDAESLGGKGVALDALCFRSIIMIAESHTFCRLLRFISSNPQWCHVMFCHFSTFPFGAVPPDIISSEMSGYCPSPNRADPNTSPFPAQRL